MSPMEEAAVAVRVEGLTKFYAKTSEEKPALQNVSFEIPPGQIWCVLGPNGSGKTTLLKILAGLIVPSEGVISIMGFDAIKSPLAARRQVGWMPAEERGGFYGRLTAKQNLNFFASLYGVSTQDSNRLIGNLAFLLDFNDEIDKMFLKTSTGARQKFGLARVLIHDPAVLLLDEPMRNLDPHAVLRFRRLLKDHLARNGKKTILLSTHQLEEARRIADHVLILHEGTIIKSLTAAELELELKQKSVEEFYMKTIDRQRKES